MGGDGVLALSLDRSRIHSDTLSRPNLSGSTRTKSPPVVLAMSLRVGVVDAGHEVVALLVGDEAVGVALGVELLDRFAGLGADADGVDPDAQLGGLGGDLERARDGVLAVGEEDDDLVALGRRDVLDGLAVLAVLAVLGEGAGRATLGAGRGGAAGVDEEGEGELERLADRGAAGVLGAGGRPCRGRA